MPRIDRLFHLLQTFRRLTPPVTAAGLAREMGVSERTVYRDIDTLRGVGAIIDGTAGYGYVLTEDPALPPMMFNDEEIEALVLGLREVRELGDDTLAEAAVSALGKLKARLPEAQSTRLRNAVLSAKRFGNMPPITIDTRALRRATWDERIVELDYADVDGNETVRRVMPLSIVFFDQTRVLLAWCCLREDFRTFRLDRIADFRITDDSFRPRRVGMLRECLARIQEASERNTPLN
jgi:predicted DNA-binding transcriptional regulator YafY